MTLKSKNPQKGIYHVFFLLSSYTITILSTKKDSDNQKLRFSEYLQSTVRSACTFIGSTLIMLDTSHLYLALLSWAFAMSDNTLSEKLPSVRYTVLTCSLFLYQTICAGGFPPRDRQVSSNCCPRFTVSPSVYPSITGTPGGSVKWCDHATSDLDRDIEHEQGSSLF